MNNNLNLWKNKLKKPKGLASQLLMSPKMRAADIKDYKNKKDSVQSSVIVLIFEKNKELHLLLTRRSTKLNKHSGQISFPGGKKDDTDIDLMHTAIREAKEEIGLNQEVEMIGELTPLLIPITNFCVHQYVAYISQKPNIDINKDEVNEVLEIPIREFLKSENIKTKYFGKTSSGRYIIAPYYSINGAEIWGATAMMIKELTDTLFEDGNKVI